MHAARAKRGHQARLARVWDAEEVIGGGGVGRRPCLPGEGEVEGEGRVTLGGGMRTKGTDASLRLGGRETGSLLLLDEEAMGVVVVEVGLDRARVARPGGGERKAPTSLPDCSAWLLHLLACLRVFV